MEEVLLTKMLHPKKTRPLLIGRTQREFSDIEKIADLLDEYVRPAVEQDGGFIRSKNLKKVS